jgi:hypothetical protein
MNLKRSRLTCVVLVLLVSLMTAGPALAQNPETRGAKVRAAQPVLAAVLTVGALVYAVPAWKDDFWGLAGRVHYTLVTVAAVAFVWFLNYWNLLGWRF